MNHLERSQKIASQIELKALQWVIGKMVWDENGNGDFSGKLPARMFLEICEFIEKNGGWSTLPRKGVRNGGIFFENCEEYTIGLSYRGRVGEKVTFYFTNDH